MEGNATGLLSSNVSPPATNATLNIGITQIELWIQLIVFFGLGGFLSATGNIAIAVGIIRDATLRSRFFVFIMFLVSARAAISSQMLVTVVYRTLRNLDMIDISIVRLRCYFVQFHAYYSLTLEMIILLGMVVDRILAIACFKYYRTLTYKSAIVGCSIATVITVLARLPPAFLGVDLVAPIICFSAISPVAPWYIAYHMNIDLPIGAFILVLYICLIGYVRFRFLPAAKAESAATGDRSLLIEYKRQKQILSILRRQVLIHCGFNFITKILIAVSAVLPRGIGMRVIAYTGIMTVIDLCSNLLLLLCGHKKLREAALPCSRKSPAANSGVKQGTKIRVQPAALRRVGPSDHQA